MAYGILFSAYEIAYRIRIQEKNATFKYSSFLIELANLLF